MMWLTFNIAIGSCIGDRKRLAKQPDLCELRGYRCPALKEPPVVGLGEIKAGRRLGNSMMTALEA